MHRLLTIGLLSMGVVCLSACDKAGIDTNVERFLTIQQGVYGQLVSRNDVGNTDLSYQVGMAVAAYATTTASEPEAVTTSGQHGFYELPLAVGPHHLCLGGISNAGTFLPWDKCVGDLLESGPSSSRNSGIDVTVVENQVSRHDYEFSVLAGWF